MRPVEANLPSKVFLSVASHWQWNNHLAGKRPQSVYTTYQEARDLCNSIAVKATMSTMRRMEEHVIKMKQRQLVSSSMQQVEDNSSSNEEWEIVTPTGAQKQSPSLARSKPG